MNSKTSILFTIPNFITAGSGREMLNIVERLDRKRFNPAICVEKKGGVLDREVEKLGISLIETPFFIEPRPLWNLIPRAKRAAERFGSFDFKLWHSFHWAGDYTEPLIAKFAGAKWIYTKKNMNWGNNWRLRSLLASKIIARNTTMMERFFSAPWYRWKTRRISGGVDIKRFSPDTPRRCGLRKSLGVKEEQTVITCVAQILPIKGQHILLEAAKLLPDSYIWLAGRVVDEVYNRELHHLAESPGLKGRVHFLGGVEDVPALLAETDIFVLPTTLYGGHEEGSPVALIEAMASGKCCVASDVAGSKDLIENNENGILVEPENTGQLAGALRELMKSSEKRTRFGKAARHTAETQYTLEIESARMQAVYEEIL